MSYINIIVSLCLSLSSCLFSFFITLWQFFVFTSVRTPRQWNFIRSVHWSYLRFKNSSIQNHNVNKKGSLVYFMVADLQRQAIRISFHETWTYQKICLWHNKSLFLMKIQKKKHFSTDSWTSSSISDSHSISHNNALFTKSFSCSEWQVS